MSGYVSSRSADPVTSSRGPALRQIAGAVRAKPRWPRWPSTSHGLASGSPKPSKRGAAYRLSRHQAATRAAKVRASTRRGGNSETCLTPLTTAY